MLLKGAPDPPGDSELMCDLINVHPTPTPVRTHKRKEYKLEQLERLRSEDNPPPSPPPHRFMITHTIESYYIPRRQSQSYKFEEFAKISNFWIFKQTLHATHFLKLLDQMCKYEIDPMSIVEDTERIRFCRQTEGRTDGQGETSIPPFQLRWSGGYNQCNVQGHTLIGPLLYFSETIHST